MDSEYQEPIQDSLFEIQPEWQEDTMYEVSVRWYKRMKAMYLPHEHMYKFSRKQAIAQFLEHLEVKYTPFSGKVKWLPLDRPDKVG